MGIKFLEVAYTVSNGSRRDYVQHGVKSLCIFNLKCVR